MTRYAFAVVCAVLTLTGISVGGTVAPGVRVTSQSSSSTVIEFTAPAAEIIQVHIGDQSFSAVSLQGCDASITEVGKPKVPTAAALLAIPTGAEPTLSIVSVETETLQCARVVPVQPETLREDTEAQPVMDGLCYKQDAWYPGTLADVAEPAVWRDLQVAGVKLYPVQVNPVRGEIAVVRRLVVRVSYSGGSYPPSVARWMMPIYAQGVANFGSLVLSTTGESDDHVKYLVFRHSNYDSNVWLNDSLIGWAHRRGYRTRVVQADGLSAGQIKDTIKAEYGLPGSQHALRFVLLVGGADEVATKRGYTREGWEGEEVGLSDHWYSEIMRRSGGAEEYGEDCYPEVTVARLVPSSNDNLICQVKKIVEYEKRPVVENDWLREMLMVGWGWRYAHPFVAMWRDVNETPSFFDYYDPTRTQLRGRWGNDYNTNYDVACEIDSGKGIVCYAGHGMCDRWWEWNEIPDGDTHYHESWTSTNVQALQNDSLNPVVFNVACSTSAFDQQSCLCNAWMQEYPAGAAATYGATQSSHNDPNFLQCTTLVRTLCDTMRIVGENIYVAPASLLGDVDMTIDANVALHYGGGWDGSNEFMYMLMGDPAMPIWTGGVPDTAVLTYPADFPCGSYLFSITVEVMGRPVEGAHVCLMREPDVYVTGWTNWEGVAGLQVNAQDTGSIYLTVSEGHALGDKPHTPILPFQGTVRASGWTWSEVAQVPPRPSGRAVKDGGCLAYDAGTDLIYASKGYKTGDFYAYDVPTDSWTRKWSIPPSVEGKQVYKGSVICSDGNGKLYLTRGNNTNDFWEYDAATDSWVQKSDVPYGESGKRVKQGAGIAWAGGAAYLLKGYRNEFYKYDPGTGEWTTLTPAPVGWHMKWDAGSWLVSDGDHTVYAFKGKYHEFYTYNINTGAWSAPKHAMPIPGHAGNKKAKDGSCAAWFSGDIYALKGGNTTEYWHYFPLADTWIQEADIPRYGSSGRRKSVKQGSALAAYPGTGLFALKGNKTFEFWRYVPGPSGGSETVEWYASGGGRVVASGGPTFDGEQPLTDGLEASKPRWNWQGTMVCYSKTDTLTEREQIYQCHYGLPIPEQRVVDMDEDCEEPVYSPSGQYIAFQLDDTVSGFYQLCVTTASGGGGGGAGGMDGVSGQPVGSADWSSEATAVSPNEDKAPNPRLGILSSKSAVDSRSAISAGPGTSGSVASLGLVWQITYAAEDHCYPEWSPNGQWLCYERDDDSGYTQIWRVPAFGGTEEQLTSGNSDHFLPSYLNSNEIVFILSPDDGYDVVGKVNVSTHQATVVSNFQTDHDRPNPAWNGTSVVAEALDDSGNTQIVKIPIWVGSETWLTSGTSDIMEPDYSQDNRSVFAVRWTGITSQIVCVDALYGGYSSVTDSLAIRDNPDGRMDAGGLTSSAVYEREAWSPPDLLLDGGGRRRHGSGIYLSRFRRPKDGPQGVSLGVFALDKAVPNPATKRVEIRWQVPVDADVSLRVYNTAGLLVKVLADGRTAPGAYTSVWNGTDSKGRRLANGVYFYALDNGAKRISRKVVLTE